MLKIERCVRQISGECKGCAFDNLKKQIQSNYTLVLSTKNSQCQYYEKTTYDFPEDAKLNLNISQLPVLHY